MMNKKEKLGLIAASAFVLSALTLTGIYMSTDITSGSGSDNKENSIDFAKLEQENITQENISSKDKEDSQLRDELSDNNDMDAELDLEPQYTAANSANAVNDRYGALDIIGSIDAEPESSAVLGTDKAAVFMEEKALSFTDGDSLVLPIIGDVIMDYSMDSAVYHQTMQQYRYSPALIIAANEGDIVTAAVDAKVTDIYNDPQTGKMISFDIGGGYELTYGQLENVKVNVGDSVSAGDIVASVAAPTIYYSEEGANIYYKLTKDGEPTDPLFRERDY
jgi:murein DD-endopeptidase MepM/ murein hydrolase activator NlpD